MELMELTKRCDSSRLAELDDADRGELGLARASARHAKRSHPRRVVIVGGGFGGLSAARALATAGDVAVTLIDRTNYHLFQPLLYQVATTSLSPDEIAHPLRAALARQRNARVLLGEVVSVDPEGRTVRLRDGATVAYDWLVIAPGARHAYFGHPEWEADAPGLKTLEDALEIRRRVLLAFERAEREEDLVRRRALLTFVVVGGGPTGVELAGAIAEMACQVLPREFRGVDTRRAHTVLVEAGPRILPAFAPELAERATAALRHRCVDVRTASAVQDVDAGAVTVNGERIATETVVWAAGVAASPLVRTLGSAVDRVGRVPVDASLRLPDHPEVFVIGDAAAVADREGKSLPGLAPVAIQQGRYVARTIRGMLAGERPRPFVYRDRGIMATVGRGQAVASTAGFNVAGIVAWWVWLLVHIVLLIGFRNRVLVMLEWAWAYLTHQRSGRLILASFARGEGS
jgi:NADH dehydrogenase